MNYLAITKVSTHFKATYITVLQECQNIFIPPLPEGGGRYTVLPLSVCLSVLPSIQDMYTILWVAFLDPSDSYFLFADLVGFIHIEHICSFFVAFVSATIDGRNLIFGHKLHIGTPISWEAFFEPSDSYFLFAKERGYPHSSSCSVSLILRA